MIVFFPFAHPNSPKVGPGDQPDVFLGPIQNSMQYTRVKGFFEDIKKENWKVAVGGDIPSGPGYFVTPTIIDQPSETSRIVVEEPFGIYLFFLFSLPVTFHSIP